MMDVDDSVLIGLSPKPTSVVGQRPFHGQPVSHVAQAVAAI